MRSNTKENSIDKVVCETYNTSRLIKQLRILDTKLIKYIVIFSNEFLLSLETIKQYNLE